MQSRFCRNLTMLMLLSTLCSVVPTIYAESRSDTEILASLDATTLPTYQPSKAKIDPQYEETYRKEREQAMQRRCELIGELYEAVPDSEQLIKLMPERWSMLYRIGRGAEVLSETTKVLAEAPQGRFVQAAMFARGDCFLRDGNMAQAHDAVYQFVEKYPTDKRGPQMLLILAGGMVDQPETATVILERLIRDYPDAPVASVAKGTLRRMNGLNKPFDLKFTDALTNHDISMQQLRGKVVVIDFWATWCKPCLDEMPHLKTLYTQYKEKGVEFIGVSLDRSAEAGGRDALINYCRETGVDWPQYYQGNGWQSDFSTSWGVTNLPMTFVVDKEGRLYSVAGTGKLDEMIPLLLGGERALKKISDP